MLLPIFCPISLLFETFAFNSIYLNLLDTRDNLIRTNIGQLSISILHCSNISAMHIFTKLESRFADKQIFLVLSKQIHSFETFFLFYAVRQIFHTLLCDTYTGCFTNWQYIIYCWTDRINDSSVNETENNNELYQITGVNK